jgi:serine/threonine protein kinase
MTGFSGEKMDNYEYLREIGKGRSGIACLVRDKRDTRLYVMKQVNLTGLTVREQRNLDCEIGSLSKLRHPSIVHYKESFILGDQMCVVMKHGEGGDLPGSMRPKRGGPPIAEGQVLRWLAEMAIGLAYVHQHNILHRDFKPANIFLSREHLVIGDFGMSKQLEQTLEKAETRLGTPLYIAPEVFNAIPYDHKADAWSLGCVLYELLTFEPAFRANNMAELIRKVTSADYTPLPKRCSDHALELVSCLLEPDPVRRYSPADLLKCKALAEYAAAAQADLARLQRSPVSTASTAVARSTESEELERPKPSRMCVCS